ncbi:hypothetical protein [Desulforegula conservatrix]|uniref:hypothetical protein n=1 Tax=Desulforegula conservatrix TaxID=153026 RepID=UPI0004218F27|nr:hypothetical protein [Desulforegula conservatrix]
MSYQVRADSEKNRLYLILGVMDKVEISRFNADVREALKELSPGFGCITDIRGLRIPVERIEQEDLEKILHVHRMLKEKSVSGIVRIAESQVWLAAALAESEMISGVNIAYVDDLTKAESIFEKGFESSHSRIYPLVQADINRNRLYISFSRLSSIDFNKTCDLIMKEASMLKPDFGCILDIRFLKVDWTNLDVKVIEDVKGVQKGLTKLGMRFVVRVVNNEFWLDNLVNREALDPETWVQLTLGEGQLDAGYKASFANNLAEAEAMLDSFKS